MTTMTTMTTQFGSEVAIAPEVPQDRPESSLPKPFAWLGRLFHGLYRVAWSVTR